MLSRLISHRVLARLTKYCRVLARRTRKEAALLGSLAVLFLIAAVCEPYNTEAGSDAGAHVVRDSLSTEERLGYAILIRAGYGDAQGPSDNGNLALFTRKHPEINCAKHAGLLSKRIAHIDVVNLTIALVAAEKYNRSAPERWLEAFAAQQSIRFRGTLPEYSYGVAQLRPATVQPLIARSEQGVAVPDVALLAELMDDCRNIQLAVQYVAQMCVSLTATTTESMDERIAKVVQAYNGSSGHTINGLRYLDAVRGAYHLLSPGSEDSDPDDADDSTDTDESPDADQSVNVRVPAPKFGPSTICTAFISGRETGVNDLSKIKRRAGEERGDPAVIVQYWSGTDELRRQRGEWLKQQIIGKGYKSKQISMRLLPRPADLSDYCARDALAALLDADKHTDAIAAIRIMSER